MDKKTIKKEENKKSSKEVNKKLNQKLLITIISIVIVLLIMIILFTKVLNKDNKGKNEKEKNEGIVATEDSIQNEYNFSKEDAIKVVKEIYNSDNYEFTATIREDNKYIVIVTNTDNNNVYKYVVDPNDGSFTMTDE